MPEYSPDLLSKEERNMYDMMAPEDRKQFDAENRRMVEDYNDPQKRAAVFAEMDQLANQVEREQPMRFPDDPVKRRGFWAEDETDEFALVEDGDEVFGDDEMTSMAHAEVEMHREVRDYMRIAAWDMPHLSSKILLHPSQPWFFIRANPGYTELAKPFTLPPQTHVLRFRYTTYMGEQHPAEPKVVLEVSTNDLTPRYLTAAQRRTFVKLAGPRYNPQTGIVKMSCEKFGTRAQNKRYLGDQINLLIKEAKEGDSFADIPLDLRHHKPKTSTHFPSEWKMTESRKKALDARREARGLRDQKRSGKVDGNAVFAEAVKSLPSLNPALVAEKEKVAVKVGAKPMKKRVR